MKIGILDFEKSTKVYKPYVDGFNALQTKATEHYDSIDKLQAEAQKIMESSSTIVLDEATSRANKERIQRIQQEAMLKDRTFKMDADAEQRRLIELAYDNISDMIKTYISTNDLDIVLNRSEVVYFKEELDVTDKIIDMMKEQNLYLG